jgi:Glycosyltransferase family 87
MQINNRWLWRVVFILASLYFVARGPWRAIHDSGDFLLVFSAARNWLHGVNPYTPVDLAATAQAAGIQATPALFITSPSVYLPSALPILAPLALLPWTIAKALWLACLVALSLWNIAAFSRIAKDRALLVAAFLLAFAPLHTGIGKGQPSVLVCSLIFLSLFTPQPYVAGCLLGLAMCIKPQLAIGFLLLALGLRQYRKLLAACAVGIASTAIGLLFIAPGWLPALRSNLREIVASTSGLASGSEPTSWYQLVNLHILIPEALTRTPLEMVLYAILISVTAFAAVRAVDRRLAPALIASATILIGYHRFYDAQLLWLGIPALLFVTQKLASWLLWAAYAVFLVPGQTIVALWVGAKNDSAGWALLLRHETLALLLICMIFIWMALKLRETGPRIAWMKSPAPRIIVSVSPHFGQPQREAIEE